MQGDPHASGDAAPPVPPWLLNLAALSWRILVVVALVTVAWLVGALLWTVTAAIAVAVVVAAVCAPSVVRLRARGWSRMAAAGVVWAATLAVGVGALLVLALAFLPSVGQFLDLMRVGVRTLQDQLADVQVPAFVGIMIEDALATASVTTGDAVAGFVASAAAAVTVGILATFLVYFFLRDGDRAWVWLFQAVSDQKRERITAAGDDALARVGGYLRGTTVLSGLIAATNLAFLVLLGVPLAVPLAVLSFFGGYIPYFGGIVTTIAILVVTIGSQGSFAALLLMVLMGIRSAIVGSAVRPVVYGRTVSIHPALVLVALPAGYQLGGVVGLFAAVPATAVILAVAAATVAILDPRPRPPLPGLVPAWLDRVAQVGKRLLVVIALIGVALAGAAVLPLVIIPVVLAVILAATFEPVVQALQGRGWSRSRAAAGAVGGGFLVVVLTLVVTMIVLVDQAVDIGRTMVAGADSLDASAGGLLALPAETVAEAATVIIRATAAIADGIVVVAVISTLSALLCFHLVRDGGPLWRRFASRVPGPIAPQVDAAAGRAAEVLGGYMFGTAAISLVGAASQLLIMLVLGLPLALPVFVLSFFLCFIPYIGGFVSTGIAFLIAIAVGSPIAVLVMVVWTIAFNLVTGNIVGPLVYGRTVHLHPAIVLLAIPAGSAIAGILGMFLVVPVLGVVAATWRTVLALMAFTASGEVAPAPTEPAAAAPGPAAGPPPGPAAGPTPV